MTQVNTSVAFLGTGMMGRGMVQALAAAGHSLTVWNRTRERAVEAVPASGTVAATPAHAVRGADVVVMMLSDPAAVRAVTDQMLGTLAPGTIVIDSSTVDPATSRETARRLAERGADFLDAPVYGSKDEAARGQLGFLVGGAPDTLERARPVLGAMARAIHALGPVGAGTTTKLVLNAVIALTLSAAQEGLVLAAKSGLDARAVLDVLMASRARSGILEMKAPRMLAHDFEPFFALRLMNKDLQLALDAAAASGVCLPGLAALKQTFNAAVAAGHADHDFCSAVTVLERAAGTTLSGT